MDIFGRVGWEAIILPTTDLQLYFFICRHLISSVWPVTSSSNLGGKFPHILKHLTGPDTGAVQVGHCFIQIDTKMTNLEKQRDSHWRAKPLCITQIWVRTPIYGWMQMVTPFRVLPESAVWSISHRMVTLQSLRQFRSLGMLSRTRSSLKQPSFRNCCACACALSLTVAYLLACEKKKRPELHFRERENHLSWKWITLKRIPRQIVTFPYETNSTRTVVDKAQRQVAYWIFLKRALDLELRD